MLKIKAYLALTKPRVVELLLITTVPTMILARPERLDFWLMLATIIGGALSAGSANAFNCHFDRDIDRIMNRTKNRPLVTGDLTPKEALVFAWVIGIVSFVWFGVLVNWLAASISLAAILFYVLVYTMILKRRTPQNIVWGGAAGAAPVLIAWAAVTGGLSAPAWILFLIVFLWTPPHYWPLAIKYRSDYENAKVPMLPVVKPIAHVAMQILIYTVAVFAVTLWLIPIAQLGVIYSVVAIVGGGWFVIQAMQTLRLAKANQLQKPMALFHFSNIYLAALFVAIAVDPLIKLLAL